MEKHHIATERETLYPIHRGAGNEIGVDTTYVGCVMVDRVGRIETSHAIAGVPAGYILCVNGGDEGFVFADSIGRHSESEACARHLMDDAVACGKDNRKLTIRRLVIGDW